MPRKKNIENLFKKLNLNEKNQSPRVLRGGRIISRNNNNNNNIVPAISSESNDDFLAPLTSNDNNIMFSSISTAHDDSPISSTLIEENASDQSDGSITAGSINNDNDKALQNLTTVRTQKGNPKLIHDGYFYTIDRTTKDHIEWKCEKQGKIKCKGRVHSNLMYYPVKIINDDHYHDPNPERAKILLFEDKLYDKAVLSNDNPRSVIKQCQVGLDENVAALKKPDKAYTKRIHRLRQTDYGPNPSSLEELNIPTELKYTSNSELFLWDDSNVWIKKNKTN